ncbi:hypothetical protein EYF80_062053 [Liparis tanakae]|uniref:Uncharacterized protein n=1 Tax=Liparis tanakae TaxID=230148 RepID=A0A4Z2EGX9_9TELE|nr:hypothetical protein EYF80_062053 [Liparis tanakae]
MFEKCQTLEVTRLNGSGPRARVTETGQTQTKLNNPRTGFKHTGRSADRTPGNETQVDTKRAELAITQEEPIRSNQTTTGTGSAGKRETGPSK